MTWSRQQRHKQRAERLGRESLERCEGCDKSCVSCKPPRGHCARCLGEVRSQGLVADGVLLHRCCAPKKKAA